MAATQRIIRQRFHEAGIKAHEKQVESTTEVHNVIEEKFAKVPEESLITIEPAYIQPTRPDGD
jgi:hypothetical protein